MTALVVAIDLHVLLNRTWIGRGVVATRANIQAARLSGIAVNHRRVIALALSAFGVVMGRVVLTARLGAGPPARRGCGLLGGQLDRRFFGMTAFKPGRATVQGTVVGVVIIGMLDNGLNLLGAPFYPQSEKAKQGAPLQTHHSASKAAVMGFTRMLAQ